MRDGRLFKEDRITKRDGKGVSAGQFMLMLPSEKEARSPQKKKKTKKERGREARSLDFLWPSTHDLLCWDWGLAKHVIYHVIWGPKEKNKVRMKSYDSHA